MICQALRGAGEPLSSPQPGTHYACIGKTCSGTGPVASRRLPGKMLGAARQGSGARSGSTFTRRGPLAPLRSNRRGSKRALSRAAAVARGDKGFHPAVPSLRSRGRRESGERRNRSMCHRRQRPPSLPRAGGEHSRPGPHTSDAAQGSRVAGRGPPPAPCLPPP